MSDDKQANTFWSKLNRIVEERSGECIPKCVQEILNCCGYDHPSSWSNFSDENLSQIVQHIRMFSQNSIKKLDCTRDGCPIAHYKNQKLFTLLPGHRKLITEVAKYIDQNREKTSHLPVPPGTNESHSALSKMMNEMIQTGIENSQVSKHLSHYTDIMTYFSTYLFIISGRSCYDFLQKNLPLPSSRTICK